MTSVFIEVCRKTGKSESRWQRSFTRRKVDGIFHTSRSPKTRFTDNHPWREVVTADSSTWLCIATEVYPSTTNFCHFLWSHEGLNYRQSQFPHRMSPCFRSEIRQNVSTKQILDEKSEKHTATIWNEVQSPSAPHYTAVLMLKQYLGSEQQEKRLKRARGNQEFYTKFWAKEPSVLSVSPPRPLRSMIKFNFVNFCRTNSASLIYPP